MNIRNLPDDVHRKLRVRAAEAGRSMEAEARAILTASVRAEQRQAAFDPRVLQDFIAGLFDGKPPPLTEELIAERRPPAD